MQKSHHPWSFPKQCRITKEIDFSKVLQHGQRIGQKHFLGLYVLNGVGYFRLGLSVGKKFGHAVERNRWKRLMREAFRLCSWRYDAGVDLVIVPSKKNKTWEWSVLQQEMNDLLHRIVQSIAVKPAPCTNGQSAGASQSTECTDM